MKRKTFCKITIVLFVYIFFAGCVFPLEDCLVKFQNPDLQLKAESLILNDDSMIIKFNGEVYSLLLESNNLLFYDYSKLVFPIQGIVLKAPPNDEINLSYEKTLSTKAAYFSYIDNLVLIDNLNQVYRLPYTHLSSLGYVEDKVTNKIKAVVKAELYKTEEIDIGPIEGALAYPVEIEISATYRRYSFLLDD